MDRYDERVYQRVFGADDWREIESIREGAMYRCTSTDNIEEQSRAIREEREQIERIYRQKGL
jgi:hypothetical protein